MVAVYSQLEVTATDTTPHESEAEKQRRESFSSADLPVGRPFSW